MASSGKSPTTILLLATLALTTAAALADVHEGTDVLGLATAPDATGEFALLNQETGPFQLHLMVYGFAHEQGIVAWDCAVVVPDGVALTGETPNGKAIDLEPTAASFRIQLSEPLLPGDGLIHLATLDFWNLDSRDKAFLLAPDPLWGDDGTMGFALQTQDTLRQLFSWPDKCPECPVLVVSAEAQPVAGATWDEVKSLFR